MARRVIPASGVLMSKMDSDAIVLNLTTETYYRLNSTALRMWEVLTGSPSVDAAMITLQEEFDVTPEELAVDIENMIATWQSMQLIEAS